MNIDGLHLHVLYKIYLDQYKQSPLTEKEQERVIIDQISCRLADDVCHKQAFFKEEVIAEPYSSPYKLIKADCYVLTENEFFNLVESIKKDIYCDYPIGHIDIVDNKKQ